NQRNLFVAHRWMLFGPIAVPRVPCDCPHDAERAERDEARRHPHRATSSSAIGADSMPPMRDPRNMTPLARPRSRGGNHFEKLRAMFGNAPASPAPNRNRIATSGANPRAAPVSIVNADHHRTM